MKTPTCDYSKVQQWEEEPASACQSLDGDLTCCLAGMQITRGKLDLIILLNIKQEEQSSEIPPLPVQLCLTERAQHVVQRLHVKVLC